MHLLPGMRALSLALFSSLLALLLLSITASPVSAYLDPENPNLRTLTSADFSERSSKGMWLVEFFSPWCPHCQAFAPTWKDLNVISEHLEDSAQFYMARVDCVAQGDLCNAQGVKGYPHIQLYKDGVKTEQYLGSRDFPALNYWINKIAEEYRKEKATPPPVPTSEHSS